MPWEAWALSRNLHGEPLRSRVLIEADEYVRSGDYTRALALYQKVDPNGLSPLEREVRALRLAHTQLALDRSRDTLLTLSKYFRAERLNEAQVAGPFALVFAYAYGRQGDFDQSLAWFSRAGRGDGPTGPVRSAADLGLRLLLRSLSSEQLYNLGDQWMTDLIVYPLIGQERRRRLTPGYQQASSTQPFWVQSSESASSVVAEASGGTLQIGAVLPLSGPFASLGKGIQQGIELAVDSARSDGKGEIELQVRDDAGDSLQSVAAARELMGTSKSSFLLGPLLTDPAIRVSDVARQEGRPILTFSKSSAFPTGNGVFRLGPTAQSQVRSLLETLHADLGLTRFALVYPRDPAGEEFARAFRTELAAEGISLAYENSYSKGESSNFLAIASEVSKANVQAVFFPDAISAASMFFSYISPNSDGFRPRPVGTANWDNPNELLRSQAVLDGAIFATPFYAADSRSQVATFMAAYRAKYQIEPDFLAAQGYDAATLVIEALRRARQDSSAVVTALNDMELSEGLTGKLHVTEQGEIDRRFKVLSFDRGAVHLVVKPESPIITEQGQTTDLDPRATEQQSSAH